MDTKKLRQKILDLAIRGKLVPQDPNDEPASVLLERIRAEKERLVKEGKIKKSKAAKTADTPHYENVPFEVPSSWVWTTVDTIAKSILYGVSESAKTCGKYRLLRITDIQNNNVQWETVPYTDFDTNKAESYLLNDGDILFARTGATVGKSYLVQGLKEEAIYASYLIRVQTYDAVLPQYVKFYFESGYYWEQIVQESVGVGQPNVNGTILGNLNIPIPPIHEQSRIVSELSKWMGIIDVIEQRKIDLQTVIKQAKSKILDLAIHGKLVPQDPTDEPAFELLKRINPKAEITCDNGQYGKMPNGWIVSSYKNIVKNISSKPFQILQSEINDKGSYPVISQSCNYIEGFTDSAEKLFLSQESIIFGDHTRNVKYLNFPFVVGADGVKILQTEACCKYIYYFTIFAANNFIQDKGYSRHYGQLSSISVAIPPLAEQHRIVAKIEELFSSLDNIQKALEV